MGPGVLKIIENDGKTWKIIENQWSQKAIMGSKVLKIIEKNENNVNKVNVMGHTRSTYRPYIAAVAFHMEVSAYTHTQALSQAQAWTGPNRRHGPFKQQNGGLVGKNNSCFRLYFLYKIRHGPDPL